MSNAPGKLSPWAIFAFVLSIGLCPVVTIAAIPAGLWALRDVRVHGRRGRRLAMVAIAISAVVTPLVVTAGWWWNKHVREPLMAGPAAVIAQGQGGDLRAFLEGTGGGGTESEAEHFLHRLSASFGEIRSTRLADEPEADAQREQDATGWWIWVPYEAMFDRGAASINTRFLISDPQRGWVTSFDRLIVEMPDGGTLHWPAAIEGDGR
ncbi:MAG: hypothetical protein QF733_01310 [Phycisphaerales bacterium]|jgi:hypothetical protein|nr:hypothetical protein [Phycisphaerales bacterium]